jgi:hypothetical protein
VVSLQGVSCFSNNGRDWVQANGLNKKGNGADRALGDRVAQSPQGHLANRIEVIKCE